MSDHSMRRDCEQMNTSSCSMTFIQTSPMTTIQDFGRMGWQDKGVSVCGAMDEIALKTANRLVGNKDQAPCIEMTMISDRILFNSPAVIALTGADMGFSLNGQTVERYRALYVSKGDVLNGLKSGSRAYMSVAGELDVDKVFGSYSTDLKGGFGGYRGRRIQKGDQITWHLSGPFENSVKDWTKASMFISKVEKIEVPNSVLNGWYDSRKIRICLSPEQSRFKSSAIGVLTSSVYEVTAETDRMGYRLSGNPLEHLDGCDILSSPLTKGSVQIPKDGQPIIMMSDRQTTGGYTKIGQVIKADLPYLAQRMPGDKIYFEIIEPDGAIDLYREGMTRLNDEVKTARRYVEMITDSRDFLVTVNGSEFKVNVTEKRN